MKIGTYEGVVSLLWNNSKDKQSDVALQELRYQKNGIRKLVIKIDDTMSYGTKQLIDWFMNQSINCNQKFTHRLDKDLVQPRGTLPDRVKDATPDGHHLVLQQGKFPYKFRVWIPEMIVIWQGDRMQFLPAQHKSNPKMGYSREVARFRSFMDATAWHPSIAREPKPVRYTPTMFEALRQAYDIDDNEVAFDAIEWYILNRLPIVRLPQDENVYAWFVELGIVPNSSPLTQKKCERVFDPEEFTFVNIYPQVENANLDLYDETKISYIGKEALLDDEDYLSDFEDGYLE